MKTGVVSNRLEGTLTSPAACQLFIAASFGWSDDPANANEQRKCRAFEKDGPMFDRRRLSERVSFLQSDRRKTAFLVTREPWRSDPSDRGVPCKTKAGNMRLNQERSLKTKEPRHPADSANCHSGDQGQYLSLMRWSRRDRPIP
jgi:hypothetical protein